MAKAELVAAEPLNGCSMNRPTGLAPNQPFILLTRLTTASNCTNYEQSMIAQSVGAVAVVNMGALPSYYIYLQEKTGSERELPDPVIPSIAISGATGDLLLQNMAISSLQAEIVAPEEESYPSLMVDLAIVLVCITLVGIVLLSFYHCCKQLSRRRSSEEADESNPAETQANRRRALELLPVSVIPADEPLDQDDVCAICIETFVAKDTVRKLPCEHRFHKDCLDPWLLSKPTCPLCKGNVLQMLDIHGQEPVPAPAPAAAVTPMHVDSEVLELVEVDSTSGPRNL